MNRYLSYHLVSKLGAISKSKYTSTSSQSAVEKRYIMSGMVWRSDKSTTPSRMTQGHGSAFSGGTSSFSNVYICSSVKTCFPHVAPLTAPGCRGVGQNTKSRSCYLQAEWSEHAKVFFVKLRDLRLIRFGSGAPPSRPALVYRYFFQSKKYPPNRW